MFEYKIIEGDTFDIIDLNKLGEDGWELCCVLPIPKDRLPKTYWHYEFLFKRKKTG